MHPITFTPSLSLSPSISNIRMMRGEEDQTSKLVYELCSVLFAILRSPQRALPPSSSASSAYGEGVGPAGQLTLRPIWPQASPAAVASLMLGVSMSLMVGGSVSFVLGFMLLPWVLGMVTLVYLAGIVSSLSGLGRAILFSSAPKEEARGVYTWAFQFILWSNFWFSSLLLQKSEPLDLEVAHMFRFVFDVW